MTREALLKALEETKSRMLRERPFSVRLTADEYRRLQKAAKAQGVPAAALARILIVTGLNDLK